MDINAAFIFNQIRKYNQARRQTLKDAALTAVGLHVGLLEKKQVAIRELTEEEQQRVLYFLHQFVEDQGLRIEIKS